MQQQFIQSIADSQELYQIFLVPTKNCFVFSVELRLPYKTVYPGKLDMSGEGYFRAKKKPEQIHKKLNAWGINAELVDRFTFKWISIFCEGREYITTTAFLRRFGKRLTFQNMDTQYLLSVPMFGLDAVKEFEKKEAMKPQQLSIFQAA